MRLGRRGLLCGVAITAAPFAAVAAGTGIFVTSNGWHSGIVLARRDIPLGVIPEVADFPAASHVEFGWGDADYYTTPGASFGMALLAALPGPAVMHVAGLPDHPGKVFPSVTVLALSLTGAEIQRLLGELARSFERDGADRAQPIAPGLYPFSRFYPATGRFHAFNTCNTWTARTLAASGLAIEASLVQTADELVSRIRPLAQ